MQGKRMGKSILAGIVLCLCLTACASRDGMLSSESASQTQQQSQIQEEQSQPEEEKTPVEEEQSGESDPIPVLIGGALPFTNMTVIESVNHPDGSYFYEDRTQDGSTTIFNGCHSSSREEGETLEDYAIRTASEQSSEQVKDISVRKDETYSANLHSEVYVVQFTAGENENAQFWTVVTTEAYGYTYFYGFHAQEDIGNEMYEIMEGIFARLTFWQPDTIPENASDGE